MVIAVASVTVTDSDTSSIRVPVDLPFGRRNGFFWAVSASVARELETRRTSDTRRYEPKVGSALPTDILFYASKVFAWVLGLTLFRFRVTGRHNIPLNTGALIASNHQSYLDPVIIGTAARRRTGYLARETLFRGSGFFRRLITLYGALPISLEGSGKDGIRLAVAHLKKKRHILVFPEGTRTHDGSVGPMHPGVKLIAERAGVPIVPAAIRGAFETWPRHAKRFRLHPLSAGFAKRFEPDELRKMSAGEFCEALRGRIASLLNKLP
ncbi:MAG: 1-acyl-sn-glycerol-3-phosphate acyltransferase [Planctomycetota bacterium]|nr:MAG: 1-acyl-sn-glycerol-3-phosphate acyltransferase [Planctomycetota bacterium]